MNNRSLGTIIERFETVAVALLKLLLVLSVALGILILYVMFINGIRANLTSIDNVEALQGALQRVFAGVLLVLLGLELIETITSHSATHRVRIELILIVAMIALGRHIVQIDFEHMSGPQLLGIGALMAALAASYFLTKSAHLESDVVDRTDIQ